MSKPAIIVVNSHVARGSVGGRASVYVLERLGYPVWFVPTVQLSWHAGHGRATRLVTEQAAFDGFVEDLAGAPSLSGVGAILSGYLGAAAQAGPIARLVTAVKARNPSARYLCDPIVGDSDGLFQPEPVATAVRDRLLPLADLATPNRHELAWLTGQPTTDNDELIAAARKLGASEVVVTSAFAGPGEIGNLAVAADGVHLASHRLIADVPHGTGDLFAARYLGGRLDGQSPAAALERASAVVLSLIRLAHELKVDEMPLAAGQHLFEAPASKIAMTRIGGPAARL